MNLDKEPEYIRIASKMIGGGMPKELAERLHNVNNWIKDAENYPGEKPQLRSRQVIAMVIEQYIGRYGQI